MTPSAQTALVNGAEPAQAPPRTPLHVVKPSSGADLVAAEQAAAAFLIALGVDLDTESLAATPARMARAYAEMFSPRPFDLTTFPNDAGYDELIIARAIPVQSVCEHHLLPFVGVAHVGYLPGERILGLSKLARVVELFARRPQVQERLTQQIADWLQDQLAPRGRGCRRGSRASVHDRAWRTSIGRQYGHLRITRPAPQRRRFSRRVLYLDRRPREGSPMNTKPSFIIVGGGMAGAIAAQTLREEGFDGKITLLGQEPNAPYERPPLSKDYLQGKADRDSIFVHPEPWYAEHGVDLSLGAAVTSLDPASRTVTTATGAQLHYDKLLLATGSKPRRLEVPGADLDGVYYLRNVEDSERLKIEFARAKRVVIIGAGWIGLETAAAARAAGLDVTLLVSGDLPLQHVLGPEVAPIFAELHRSHGVDLRYRTTAAELTGRHGAVTGVMLSDGTRIDADMIIVGIGAVPRTELAAAAGLKIDNGIVVDEHLRTSDPDIFAAGDIAHAYNPRLGRHIRVEHWANARRQGVIAAKAMLGQDAVDLRPSYFFTDQYDLSMEYTGDIGPAGYDRVDLPPVRRLPSGHRLLALRAACPGWHEHQHLGCRRGHRTTGPISTPDQCRRSRRSGYPAGQFVLAAGAPLVICLRSHRTGIARLTSFIRPHVSGCGSCTGS